MKTGYGYGTSAVVEWTVGNTPGAPLSASVWLPPYSYQPKLPVQQCMPAPTRVQYRVSGHGTLPISQRIRTGGQEFYNAWILDDRNSRLRGDLIQSDLTDATNGLQRMGVRSVECEKIHEMSGKRRDERMGLSGQSVKLRNCESSEEVNCKRSLRSHYLDSLNTTASVRFFVIKLCPWCIHILYE